MLLPFPRPAPLKNIHSERVDKNMKNFIKKRKKELAKKHGDNPTIHSSSEKEELDYLVGKLKIRIDPASIYGIEISKEPGVGCIIIDDGVERPATAEDVEEVFGISSIGGVLNDGC